MQVDRRWSKRSKGEGRRGVSRKLMIMTRGKKRQRHPIVELNERKKRNEDGERVVNVGKVTKGKRRRKKNDEDEEEEK